MPLIGLWIKTKTLFNEAIFGCTSHRRKLHAAVVLNDFPFSLIHSEINRLYLKALARKAFHVVYIAVAFSREACD